MPNETSHYYSGNPEHLGKPKRYLTNTRELLRLLHNHKIHVFYHTNLVEWLGDASEGGHGRLKVLCDTKRVYANNTGLYRVT
jgi:hypothetical protein